ncbi:MAG: hypothetical protein EOP84_19465 [Verrucomicrobiaceae bacterium]|nr:MAG: hypothetical protein EOP84_19465 [Verrucomicrobiaceae bacterium]
MHRFTSPRTSRNPEFPGLFELYDYEADPAETKSLAADQSEVVAQLRAILDKHPEARLQISGNANPEKPAAAKRPVNREELFAKKDTDDDGKLTREEFLANQPDPDKAPQRFTTFDVDMDGVLSRVEFVCIGKRSV